MPSKARTKWVSHIGETGAAPTLTDMSMVIHVFLERKPLQI
ncbi:hypothetical protein HMPREF9999_02120 [Alloprevotella sp. oral taxon 473 str. F0040]|nr:hypothetical protein HMPREF9999_02120 [Alloprevotella sp. oral taxon 473 str. F0040]